MFSISVIFQISINNAGFAFFLGTLEMVTGFVTHWETSQPPINCFPVGFPSLENDALVVSIPEAIHDALGFARPRVQYVCPGVA